MKKIGFFTCQRYKDLAADDLQLIPLFKQADVQIIPVVWNKPVNYDSFDLLVCRSIWDYHEKTKEFLNWLDTLASIKTPIYNPPAILKATYDKFYLKDLQHKGFSIIPTLFFETASMINLPQIMKAQNWSKGVIKPAISLSAYKTFAFDQDNAPQLQKQLASVYGNAKVLVQQFVPEINHGEYSLVFFGKAYCITALKTPKKGDFRVQSELGGTIKYVEPPKNIIAEAKTVLESYPEDILYARMDGIIKNGHFQIMEVEMIDPELYFQSGEKVRKAFLNAVLERI